MSTIRELARLAGVSVGTVSRVLNDAGNVDEAIRQRTLEAIEASGYQLRPRGRRPSARSQAVAPRPPAGRTLLVAAPEMSPEWATHELWQGYLAGIRRACEERGYTHLVCMSDNLQPIGELCQGNDSPACGVLVKIGELNPDALVRLPAAVPVVGFGSYQPACAIPQVAIDDYGAGVAAANALLERGHRRIVFANPLATSPRFIARVHGYTAAMRKAGFYDPELVLETNDMVDGRVPQKHLPDKRETLRRVRELSPSAVIVANDWHALGLYQACAQAGISIPDDLSIMGVDDTSEGRAASPPLATIGLAFGDVAYFAVNTLIDMIEGAGRHLRGRASAHYVPVHVCPRSSIAVRGPSLLFQPQPSVATG